MKCSHCFPYSFIYIVKHKRTNGGATIRTSCEKYKGKKVASSTKFLVLTTRIPDLRREFRI